MESKIKHTDSVEAKIQDFSSKFYYSIEQRQVKYEDLVDWLHTTLQANQSQQVEQAVIKARHSALTDVALWINEHVGSSSKAIYLYMTTGVKPRPFDAPWDASDRERCIYLLRAVPEWIGRLYEIEDLNITGTRDGIPVKPWNEQLPLIREALTPNHQD